MITRRERWGLSWRGCAVLLFFIGLATGGFLFGVYPFFAVSDRVETRLLVVEGWVDNHAIKVAAEEFQLGGYERVFSTGGPVEGVGGYVNDYSTAASIGAGRLKQAGVPAEKVQMVPSRVSARDRTYGSAVALREWCEQNQVPLTAVNVLTVDVHARRSRLLFQMALGPKVKVGIISVPNVDYDAARWWRYSEGVRAVIGESIAYAYVRFLFFP
ncbi:MAG: ElyC/SanA/YdcF family protein [Opitutaceae bacterium]